MPIITTFVTARPALGSFCKVRLAIHSWPIISATVKLRLNPWRAVEQKVQSKAQPTCEDTHKVPRSSSGINTVSMALPSAKRKTHLQVPSADCCSITSSGARISVCSCKKARSDLLRLVICATSSTPI